MVSYAKKNAFWNGFGDVLSVVSIVASGCSLVKGLGIVGGAAGTAGGVAGTADDATRIMVDGTGDIAGTGLRTAGQSVDDLIAGGKPIANSALYGLGDDTAAAATDKLIKSGYTLVDDTWQLPASAMGAPTAANSAFNSMANTVDDLVATGKPIANSSLYSLGDEGASLATDKLIAKGYTLVDDTWQLPASASGAPSLSSGSAFGKIVDDTPVNYIDEAINSGKTMGSDGFTAAAKFRGAPSSAETSALAGDLSKTVSKDSITLVDKGLYYGREGLHQVGTTVKNGLTAGGTAVKEGISNAGSVVKNGLSTAGSAVKNGLSAAGTGLKTAGTWVYENGVPVLKETVTNLGTSGVVGQVANVGQNAVNTYQVNRTAEMVARANEHFGNNGN
jgi:hypothetical protein